MRGTKFVLAALLAALPAFILAQEKAQPSAEPQKPKAVEVQEAPKHFYRLEFVVQELGPDGKPVNSRSYSVDACACDRENQQIRTGARIPIATSLGKDGEATQFQYIDIGVNIDVNNVREVDGKLTAEITADITSVADAKSAGAGQAPPLRGGPTIRQNKWRGQILIPIAKPTPVFSAEDLDSKGALQVIVTAAKIG
ncbi:MAG: hypothetical protein WCE75_03895 [Terracidiphilus sp.]